MGEPIGNIIDFTLTYNRFKRQLFNFTLKMVNDRSQCEDIIQNVFIKLFENINAIRNPESIQFWLFSTVRNEIYSYYRRKKIHVDQYGAADSDEIEIDSDDDVAGKYEEKEFRELILVELNKLSISHREVFLLKEYGGLSYKEIADVMRIDEELVKSRLFKTRQKLIKHLAKFVER